MRKMHKVIISLIIISILIYPVIAIDNQSIKKPAIYRVLIDQFYGFYRTFEMYNKLLGKEIYPENRTLNISKGDTVTLVNDAIPDKELTIVSQEKLWSDKNGTLKHSGKEFSYTFNKSGIYNIYIRERPILKQKIIIGPIDANTANITEINNTKSNLTDGTKPGQTNVTKTNDTKSNLTNDTKPGQTNVTKTNDIKSNLTTKSDQNNTTAIKQNSTLNKPNSVPISIRLTDGLSSKIKSKSDIFIMTIVLLGIYILSRRIKDG